MKLYSILIALYINYVGSNTPPPLVDLPLGQIEGTTDTSLNGRIFYKFEGVPFAKPPVGKHRFKEPVPIKPWKNKLIANTIYKCMQYNHFTPPGQDMIIGDEDCLYLNIYTPNLQKNAQYDVIVYIHGGAFMFNYGGYQQPHYQMDKNIVSVTINYRLGPLGFLSTESDVVPGNNGIKDQIIALQWIKDNIQYFGGNPNSITIFGMSAGGASVHLHQLIPKSKGLFSRAVSQSGCALNPWVIMENPLEKSKKLANAVGCDDTNTKQMIDCLRKKTARQIVGTVKLFQKWLYNPFSPFGVVVDSSWATDPLLTQHPYKLLSSKTIVNDVPWIASIVSSEGLYPASDFYFDDRLNEIEQRWDELLPFLLDYNYTVDATNQKEVNSKIKEFYLKNEKLSKANFMKFVQIFSDRLFIVDLEKATRLQASFVKSPIYFSYFGYRGTFSRSESRTQTKDNLGASHADDTSYFYKTTMDTTTTAADKEVVNLFLEMFTTFANTGKPSVPVDWKPLSKNQQDNFNFLKIISGTNLQMGSEKVMGNRQFWESLPIKENEKLFARKDEL